MGVYYSLYVHKKGSVDESEIVKISETLRCFCTRTTEYNEGTLIKFDTINSYRYDHLVQLYPFDDFKMDPEDEAYELNEDYAFSEEEKAIITNFFADIEFVMSFHDCLFDCKLWTRKSNMIYEFDDSNFTLFEDLPEVKRKEFYELLQFLGIEDIDGLIKFYNSNERVVYEV